MQNVTPQSQKKLVRLEPCTNFRQSSPQQPMNAIPDGYMTSAEFWKKVKKGVTEICQEHGVL